ncbi:MAG: hypothetical protein CEE42_07065 [Promethearchaeota archaeon Loki_b31]|nr:MAG: hypothetical protein CEE42_07065 [Candidatus Lokiarchaeota archaeon Loki_b31]
MSIDLIIFKSNYQVLSPMGIELKYLKGIRQGNIIARAFYQILFKYATSHFKGLKLKTLCIGTYYSFRNRSYDRAQIDTANILTKSFLTYFGIGVFFFRP